MDDPVGDADRRRQRERRRRADDLLRQRRGDRDDLERRARLVDVGDDAVAPLRGRGRAELVRVEAGRDRHREHAAGARVEHDRAASLGAPLLDRVAQHRLRVRLDAMVDRQEDVVAGPLRLRRDHVDHTAGRIADGRLAAGLADERLVERALEPFEAVVVDPGVAEHVRSDAALRVVAQLLGVEPEPGQVQLLQRRRLRGVGLPLDVDEVARLVGEERVELLGVDSERVGRRECDPARILHLTRIGIDGRRLLADRERLARAVEDRAAPGRDHGRPLMLALGHPFEAGRLHALDPDRARQRPREDDDEEAEQEADAAVGEPLAHFVGGAS